MKRLDDVTTSAKVEIYKASNEVFRGLMKEMRTLSGNKPEASLSKNKVSILNRVLDDLLGFLQDEPEGKYLQILDDDHVPQNSDAVLVMVQYEKALSAFLRRYSKREFGDDVWATQELLEEPHAAGHHEVGDEE